MPRLLMVIKMCKETKICTKCKRELPATHEYFNRHHAKPLGLYSRCKECTKIEMHGYRMKNKTTISKYGKDYYQKNKGKFKVYHRRWYETNREKYLLSSKEYKKQWNKLVKSIVISHYGGKCACRGCGESRIGFLTIDHVNGGGARHRSQVGGGVIFYRWLIKNNFPPGFQVLCFNCNCGRQTNGGVCPHEQ